MTIYDFTLDGYREFLWELTVYTPPLSNFSESAAKNHEHQDVLQKPNLCCGREEQCLNPDAVAVMWFKCVLCGRTRKQIVKAEVW